MWTIRHMIHNGVQLRTHRTKLGLSQSKLAEITGLPQHKISAFELQKTELCPISLAVINNALLNDEKLTSVIRRRKRFTTSTYTKRDHDMARRTYCKKTTGNTEYLEVLGDISSIPRIAEFTGLSLFSGCGGLSLGFRSAGCSIKGFVEIDEKLSHIYTANFDTIQLGSDITAVTNQQIKAFLKRAGDIDVIIGGPPCQGFSLAGQRKVDDPRNQLFRHYMRFIEGIRPKVAIMENVRVMTSMKSPQGGFVKDEILNSFIKQGYRVTLFNINALNYGVPQHRERVIFIAIREDLNISPTRPPETHSRNGVVRCTQPYRSFADACSDLAYLEAGEKTSDLLHKAVAHPDHVIRWLWDVPQGRSAHDNVDPLLRPPSGYNTTYKRQVWDEPGATVQTTFGMISGCRNVHPVATRSLTIREAARLQSFPDNFRFIGSLGAIRTGIGNAVPPLLGRAIADHIRSILPNFVKISGL